MHSALWTHQLLIITTEGFLLLVRRKILPSAPRQLWTFSTTKSVHIRCPCLVRCEEHVTEGSELRCPEARHQESSPPMLSTDDGLSGVSKVALLVNGTGTAKLPLPPTPIQAGAADIGALQSCQPAPPLYLLVVQRCDRRVRKWTIYLQPRIFRPGRRVVESEACGWTRVASDDDDDGILVLLSRRENESTRSG